MAPLPSNNTPRFRVHYTNAGKQHTLNIRSNDSPAAVGLNVDDLLDALVPMLFTTTIDFVEFSATGSNVFNTVVTGIEGNSYGGGSPGATAPATYINFIGRSSDGRRVRAAIFGVTTIGVDFRWQPTESAAVDAAINALEAPANHWLTVGGLEPVWKQYANAGFNAYWQKQIRP